MVGLFFFLDIRAFDAAPSFTVPGGSFVRLIALGEVR